jgi:hypothetical protein
VKTEIVAVLLVCVALGEAATAAPMTTGDVDLLMLKYPPPAIEEAPPTAHPETVCIAQTCQRLTGIAVLVNGDIYYDVEWNDNASHDCLMECGDGSFCPELSEWEAQQWSNVADAYCWGQLGLPRGSSVYSYCSMQQMLPRSVTHCQGGNGGGGGGGGKEP